MPKLSIRPNRLDWWYWALTLAAMITGLSGYTEGFHAVILISIIQTVQFAVSKGLTAFPTQVRLVYTLFVIIALFDPTRIFYWMLLVGTFMVTFFDRCIIARVLIMMPWNKNAKLS